MAKDNNGVSVWFWIFALILTRIPCFGFLISIFFAFLGTNETRKNFFKAVLLLDLFVFAVLGALVALGFAPTLWELAQKLADQWPKLIKGG